MFILNRAAENWLHSSLLLSVKVSPDGSVAHLHFANMSVVSRALFLALFCLPCVLRPGALAVDHVPTLLWSTHRFLWDITTPVYSGHITSRHELHNLLQPVLQQEPKNLVVFLQDMLSIDDFTYLSNDQAKGKAFYNLQEILNSSASSLVLPAVDWKAISHVAEYLQKKADWHLVDLSDNDFSDLEISHSKPNLILVKLKSRSRESDVPSTKHFTENDKKIGMLTAIMQEKKLDFTALYSALRPSRVRRSVDMASEQRRQLMATETVTTVPYPPLNVTNGTATCIILYSTNITLTVNQSIQLDLTNQTFVSRTVDTRSSICSTANSTLSLKYYNLTAQIRSLEIRFVMLNQFYAGSARNWFTVDYVQIILEKNSTGALFTIPYASSPAEYSFHCQLMGTSVLYGATMYPANAEARNWNIYIEQFQIQGFHVKNSLFSYSTDCTGFFSAPIWMALVSSIVLLWILSYGIFMIMQLTTNDKFDDPKRQPLSVPQTE